MPIANKAFAFMAVDVNAQAPVLWKTSVITQAPCI